MSMPGLSEHAERWAWVARRNIPGEGGLELSLSPPCLLGKEEGPPAIDEDLLHHAGEMQSSQTGFRNSQVGEHVERGRVLSVGTAAPGPLQTLPTVCLPSGCP